MKISVFTPSHDLKYIDKPLNSLLQQEYKDFEWIILLNGEALKDKEDLENRLSSSELNFKIIEEDGETKSIGLFKKKCCAEAKGEILVELDHDDALTFDCLKKVHSTFEKEKCDFCYSDDYAIQTNDGKEEYIAPFSSQYGWKVKKDANGNQYHLAPEVSALTFSYIWYAPDHVRAWKKSFYHSVGGHDESLEVCDDYDLLCRTYIHGKCHKINEPLYKYYANPERTSAKEKNEEIQKLTHSLHDKYMLAIASKWSDENSLKKVDLCSCDNKPNGFIGVDKRKLNKDDVVFDLDEPDWPFEDGSVGVFRAQDAVEHMKDPVNTMKEIYRCLADYGWAIIDVPSTDGRGAFQDPTHVSFWNSNTFWYYTKSNQATFIGTPVKFQLNRIDNYYPSDFHEFHNIVYTRAHLVKLPKDGFEIPMHGREI